PARKYSVCIFKRRVMENKKPVGVQSDWLQCFRVLTSCLKRQQSYCLKCLNLESLCSNCCTTCHSSSTPNLHCPKIMLNGGNEKPSRFKTGFEQRGQESHRSTQTTGLNS